jgi:hypothetical protein
MAVVYKKTNYVVILFFSSLFLEVFTSPSLFTGFMAFVGSVPTKENREGFHLTHTERGRENKKKSQLARPGCFGGKNAIRTGIALMPTMPGRSNYQHL